MESIPALIAALTGKDAKAGRAALEALRQESRRGPQIVRYLPEFFAMLDHPSSYVRTRGFLLIAANARWDTAGWIDSRLDQCLAPIQDEKPVTARQCIQVLPELAWAKPGLIPAIRTALERADASGYPDSMRPLIESDIAQTLAALTDGQQEV